jgi:hypothetical protein
MLLKALKKFFKSLLRKGESESTDVEEPFPIEVEE